MEPRTSSPKNIHPCIFLGCKFAGQTCYCVVPPTSVSGMIRRGVIFSQQRHIGKHTFRKPFEIDDADTLPANVHPCTFAGGEFLQSKNVADVWNHGHPCPF